MVMKHAFCLKSTFMSFLTFPAAVKISLVSLCFLLEREALSNQIETGILTLLQLARAEKILVPSYHPFNSILSPTEKHLV